MPFSKPETSPFTPGHPVPPDLFVGRQDQIGTLLDLGREARSGRLRVGYLAGERGIGKTSLARLTARISEREHGLLPLYIGLGGATGPEEVVRRTLDALANVTRSEPWWEGVKALFGNRIRQVGLFGASVEFAPRAGELATLTNRFDNTVRGIVEALPAHREGLFLVFDDMNGLVDSPHFATWLKNFVDTVAFADHPFPVVALFVGSEQVRRRLARQNESAARIFHLVDIAPWSDEDSAAFFGQAFARAGMRPEPEALETLVTFTGGLPVLAHEIGDAAFRKTSERLVTPRDAFAAVTAAADIVGRKYLEPQVVDRIRSGRYHALLRAIPRLAPSGVFLRRDLAAAVQAPEGRVLDNFLREMVKLGMLERVSDEGPGTYRFVQNLHFVYFMVRAAQKTITHQDIKS